MQILKYLIVVVFLTFIGIFSIFYFQKVINNRPLINPVLGVQSFQIAENIWSPKVLAESSSIGPAVTSRAALFVETNTGKVLYEKNIHERLRIASLVKIMTAIVTLENAQMSDKILISERAAGMEPDSMLLKAGERLTVEELLQGLFLVSGNDASEALAEGVTGRREEFINLMNSRALQLGMNNTRFINPSGLEEDGREQYSSAYDTLLMARYAIRKWPELVKITSTEHIFIPATGEHQDYDLYSGINLLTTYQGVLGFKTGYTGEAGLTLVTLARKGKSEVVGVLLGSEDRRAEARELLDLSFEKLGESK